MAVCMALNVAATANKATYQADPQVLEHTTHGSLQPTNNTTHHQLSTVQCTYQANLQGAAFPACYLVSIEYNNNNNEAAVRDGGLGVRRVTSCLFGISGKHILPPGEYNTPTFIAVQQPKAGSKNTQNTQIHNIKT